MDRLIRTLVSCWLKETITASSRSPIRAALIASACQDSELILRAARMLSRKMVNLPFGLRM
jgi:hypothetical protein